MKTYETVDDYLSQFNGESRKRLDAIRKIILSELPRETIEKISYGIPTYYLKRNLIHFGGYENHISIYPRSRVISELKDELKAYKTSKGTIQFPLDKALDKSLIKKIISLSLELNQKSN